MVFFPSIFLRREGNMATYGLVKYTQFVDDFVIWMEETPPIINSEISSDVNQLLQVALVD